MAGQTTTIQQNSTSIDGILAKYTVKIDNNGYITGYGLMSSNNNGTPSSSFVIRADSFALVMPGYGDYVPFAVGPAGVSLYRQHRLEQHHSDLASPRTMLQ